MYYKIVHSHGQSGRWVRASHELFVTGMREAAVSSNLVRVILAVILMLETAAENADRAAADCTEAVSNAATVLHPSTRNEILRNIRIHTQCIPRLRLRDRDALASL